MVNENNKNAYIGQNIESAIKISIIDHPDVIQKIKESFHISGKLDNTSKAGIYGDKSDVRIAFTCGHYIDANIKGYKMGFNQLTRTTISKFCEEFGLSANNKTELENIVVRKSKNTTMPLFDEVEQKKWGPFFKKNIKNLLKWGFSANPSREVLVLYDRNTSIVRIYPMKKVLLKLESDIKFTKGGFNIGECVSFQRKGGNGSLSKHIPKTDIRHPGNNIQLKLKVFNAIALLESIKLAEYSI